VSSAIDWDALASAVPVILWILFLVLKKKRAQKAPQDPQPRARRPARSRRDDTPKFERGYDPIEPS